MRFACSRRRSFEPSILRRRLWPEESPVRRTLQLDEEEIEKLYRVTVRSLSEWVERLRDEAGEGFPEKITAFHPAMGAHGKYRQPCPVCGTSIQRIVYESRETDYCPTCQTGGKLLADRSLSRILREDWPRTVEEMKKATRARKNA